MGVNNERRRQPGRRHASLFVGCTDGAIRIAQTRDLSLTGIFLVTEARPAPGATLEVSIAWGDDLFSFEARVVRAAADGIALSFIDPDTLLLQALQEIMDTAPAVEPRASRP